MSNTASAYDMDGEFGIGLVVGRSLSVLGRNIVPFFLLSLVFFVIMVAVPIGLVFLGFSDLADADFAGGEPNLEFSALLIATVLASVVFMFAMNYLLTGTIVFGTVQDLRGEKAGILTCLMRGLAQIVPVLLIAIIFSIAVTLGFVLLIVPGIIFICVYGVAVPAAVVERCGVFGSLARSAELTRGYRWQIFGILVVVLVIETLVSSVVQAPGIFVDTSDLLSNVFSLLVFAVQILSMALNAVVIAVIYHDLRVAQEGSDSEDIAAVFD